MRRLRPLLLAVVVAAVPLKAAGAAHAAPDPNGTGPPSQSCQDQTGSPGQASSSPGSPFNEPSSTSSGGTGGQHYTEKSQYDVACYQVSV